MARAVRQTTAPTRHNEADDRRAIPAGSRDGHGALGDVATSELVTVGTR